jgi:hypothetical protein
MQIAFSKHEGRVPVSVMKLTGNLDASNYASVITKAQDAYDEGARDLLIDLSDVPYISGQKRGGTTRLPLDQCPERKSRPPAYETPQPAIGGGGGFGYRGLEAISRNLHRPRFCGAVIWGVTRKPFAHPI